ncbi:MAG: VOC family protein [Chloroflexi bacterium]|nr:VOC family protein [Chloroflexota bacterium]
MAKINALQFILPVKNLDSAAKFYCDVFDLEEMFRNESIVFVGIPGTESAVGLLLEPKEAGSGLRHVGLHVDHDLDRADVLAAIKQAGGSVVEEGEHGPGLPWARIADPDGNVLEI